MRTSVTGAETELPSLGMRRRWTLRLVVLAGLAGAAWCVWRRRGARSATPGPTAPVEPRPERHIERHADPTPAWAAPLDGGCPDGYPVKVNEASGIFHVPGGRSYERTVPNRCYVTATAAESDGYRQAKA